MLIATRSRHTAIVVKQTATGVKVVEMQPGELVVTKLTEEDLTAEWGKLDAIVGHWPGEEMMKPYMVKITTWGVVMAEDGPHAHQVALSHKREIFGDDADPRIELDGVVEKTEDLTGTGWDGECIPYGGDGNTKLADLLMPNACGEPGLTEPGKD